MPRYRKAKRKRRLTWLLPVTRWTKLLLRNLLMQAIWPQEKDMYIKVCAACHLADGGGVVGPNLTDEYWIHGGSISDIFKTIKYGWQDKGMKSWKDDFSPKQIQQLSSFVRTLKGTKPATPKAPQGELYAEAGAAAIDSVKTADSAKVKADVAQTVK